MDISDATAANIKVYNHHLVVLDYTKEKGLCPIERELIQLYFPPPPARILDIGCGAGRTTTKLLELGYFVTAIDLADGLLQVARTRAPEACVIKMSATQLGFADGSFDAALFSFNGIDCVYPITERKKVFSEVKRVLVPQGVFYFSSHNILGQFGRNSQRGVKRGLRNNLLFSLNQLKNRAIWEGYGIFKEKHWKQLLYGASPKTQLRMLESLGLKIRGVRGLKRCKDCVSVSLAGYSPSASLAFNETLMLNPKASQALSGEVEMRTLTWFYPHIQYVVST